MGDRLYFFSNGVSGAGAYGVKCLTNDYTQGTNCTWNGASCAVDDNHIACDFDDGTKQSGDVTKSGTAIDFDTMSLQSTTSVWTKFSDRLTGLYYGSNRSDYFVLTQANDSLTAWWGGRGARPKWAHADGTMSATGNISANFAGLGAKTGNFINGQCTAQSFPQRSEKCY